MRITKKCYLLLFLVASNSWSEATSPENINLEKVIISGQSLEETLPQKIADYGSKLEVISAADIRSSGAIDASKALQMLAPGLYISPKNGAFDYTSASLQGSRSQDILWLVDGIRINNRLYASTSPLDTIPASIISRIEILKGGQGIFYGTQAISGVVNIVTHSLSNTDSGQIKMGINSNDGFNLSANKSGGNRQHQYLVFADSSQAEGFQPYKSEFYEDSATDRKRGYDNFSIGGKYGYQLNDKNKISVFYQRNLASHDFSRPTDNFSTQNNRSEDLAYLKLDSQITDAVTLLAKTYYHNWDTRYTRLYNDSENSGNIIIKNDDDFWGYQDYGLNLMTEIKGTDYLDYTLGYDYQNFSGKDDVLLIEQSSEQVQSIFAQVASKSSWLEDTAISIGTRYNKPSGNGDKMVGQFTAIHHLNPSLYIRTNTGTSFRLPTAYELYAIDSCCTQGNSNLEPETGLNYNLALGSDSAGLNWDLSAFKREIDNLIQGVEKDGIKTFENTDNKVNFEGVAVNVGTQISSAYSLNFNHVYSSAQEKGNDQQINNIPLNHSKLNLKYRPINKGLRLTLSANHVGDNWDVENDQRINYGNYTFVDISAECSLDEQQQHWLALTLENVTNTDYASSIATAKKDADDTSYVYENRGTPFTAHLSYSYNF